MAALRSREKAALHLRRRSKCTKHPTHLSVCLVAAILSKTVRDKRAEEQLRSHDARLAILRNWLVSHVRHSCELWTAFPVEKSSIKTIPKDIFMRCYWTFRQQKGEVSQVGWKSSAEVWWFVVYIHSRRRCSCNVWNDLCVLLTRQGRVIRWAPDPLTFLSR